MSGQSSDGGFLRKLNPAKLLDAGASAIAGVARSGGSSVSDKISNLFGGGKKDDQISIGSASHATHQEVVQAFAVLRPTVAACSGAASADTASFNITLLDRRNNMPVTTGGPVTRTWRECEAVLSMIASLFPRLEGLPPAPARSGGKTGAAAASEIDDRRKYVQRCLEVLCAHQGAAATKDLQRFLKFGADDGLGTLTPGRGGGAPAPAPVRPAPLALSAVSMPAGAASPASATAAAPAAASSATTSQRSLQRTTSFTTGPGGQQSTASATSAEDDDMPQHFDEQELIRDVFNIVDDDGSGYLDPEELEPFFEAIPRDILTEEQCQKCLSDADKEQTGVIDIRNFRALCQHLVATSKTPLLDIVRPFRAKHIATMYECIATVCTDPDPPPLSMEVDREEARVLLLVLLNVGLRVVTPTEVAKHELAMPVSLIDFDSIVDAFLYCVSFSELVKCLAGKGSGSNNNGGGGRKTADEIAAAAVHSKVLKLVNRVAARASPKVIKLMRERIAKAVPESACAAALQTSLTRSASAAVVATCTSCDQMKKQIAELQAQLSDVTEQLAKAQAAAAEQQSPASPTMSPKVTEMVRAQLDEAVQDLDYAHGRIEELEAQVRQLGEENAKLREEKQESDALDPAALGFAGNEAFLTASGGQYAAQTLYLLPTNMPSAGMGGDGWRRGVIDRAGALTYDGFTLDQGEGAAGAPSGSGDDNDGGGADANPLYRPMGWTVDLYMVDAMGVEHMACRDKGGRRSIAWSLERGKLVCPWSRTVIAQLPLGKWARLTAQIHWAERCVTWLLDGKTAVQRQPFRDAASEEIATLDLYPRSSLVLCYANMRFFK